MGGDVVGFLAVRCGFERGGGRGAVAAVDLGIGGVAGISDTGFGNWRGGLMRACRAS